MTTTIKITDNLAQHIDEYVGYFGYTSRTDFIRKAIKQQLESLEGAIKEEKQQ